VIHKVLQRTAFDAGESGSHSHLLREDLAVNRAAVADPDVPLPTHNARVCEAARLRLLGWAARLEGDLAVARAFCESGLVIARDVGEAFETANSLRLLGHVCPHQGHPATP
jgi:hypothetical protein